MANIRYQSTFKNIDNVEFKISIVDKSYSGSVVSDFEVSSELFTLDYDSGEENYNPLVSSQLTINILLKVDAVRNDTTLFTFLKSMVQQNTQLYYIKIEENRGSGFENYWIGNIVQNQSSYANAPIESGIEFQVIANDFGFLENKPFEQLIDFFPSSINFTTDIITLTTHNLETGQVIKFKTVGTVGNIKVQTNYFVSVIDANNFQICSSYENATADTPIVINLTGSTATMPTMAYTDFGLYRLNEILNFANFYQGFDTDTFDIWNNINWFENSVTGIPSVNILRSIDSLLYNFYEFSDATNSIFFIDIIKNICQLFGCRIIQTNGQYYVIQLQNYTATTSVFRNEASSKTVTIRKKVDNTVGVSALKILAGSIYSWVRPFSKIIAKQPTSIITKVVNKLNDTYFYGLPGAIDTLFYDLYGGHNNKIKVSVKTVLSNPNSIFGSTTKQITNFAAKQHLYQLYYDTGGTIYYLQSIGGVFTWSSSAPAFVAINFNLTANDNGEYNSQIITPELPNPDVIGRLRVALVLKIVDAGLGAPTAIYADSFCNIEFLPRGFQGEEITFQAALSPQPFDAIIKEIPDLLLWDTYDKVGKGTMTITSSGEATNSWQVGRASSFQYPILELVIRNALALNYRAKQLIEGTFRGNYYPHELLTYDGIQWCLKRATFTAGSNQWNGEWFELTYNDSDISTAQNIANNGDFEQGKLGIVKPNKDGTIYDYMRTNNENIQSLASSIYSLQNSLQTEVAERGNSDNNIYQLIQFLLPSLPFIAYTTSLNYSGETITSIGVDNLTKDVKTNDELTVINLVNGQTFDIIASANEGVGSTSISINSYTLLADLDSTCIVMFKIKRSETNQLEIKN